MFRLAAFDMDGTLLMPDHRVGAETLDALKQLEARRVAVTFATGRHYLEVANITRRLGLQGYLITGNGTRVHNRAGEQIFSSDLPPDVAHEVLHMHWDTSAQPHVFRDDGWLTGSADPREQALHAENDFHCQLVNLRTLPAYGISKVCFCGEHEELQVLQADLLAHFGSQVDLCFSAYDSLEVLPVGTNKGTGLRHLCEHLEIDPADCMAFGDAMNDREMLGMVGKGYIMGNALPQLKQSLPHLDVIGRCDQQAVADRLHHWLHSPNLTFPPN